MKDVHLTFYISEEWYMVLKETEKKDIGRKSGKTGV